MLLRCGLYAHQPFLSQRGLGRGGRSPVVSHLSFSILSHVEKDILKATPWPLDFSCHRPFQETNRTWKTPPFPKHLLDDWFSKCFRPRSWWNIAWRNVDSGRKVAGPRATGRSYKEAIRCNSCICKCTKRFIQYTCQREQTSELIHPSITSFKVWLLNGLWHSGASWAHPASHHIFQSFDFDPPVCEGVAFSWQRLLVFYLKWWWALWWFLMAWWCSSGWRLGDTWPHTSLWHRLKMFQLKR